MSRVIDAYWRSRLDMGRALYGRWNPGVDFEQGTEAWPLYISRYAAWEDFLMWHRQEFAPMFPEGHIVPETGRVTDFFDHMRKYHFGQGRAYVHGRTVKIGVRHQGDWRYTTVKRKFIRYPTLEQAKQYWLDAH